jgi:hypothetical protein
MKQRAMSCALPRTRGRRDVAGTVCGGSDGAGRAEAGVAPPDAAASPGPLRPPPPLGDPRLRPDPLLAGQRTRTLTARDVPSSYG